MSNHHTAIAIGDVDPIQADISHLTQVIAHLGELATLKKELERLVGTLTAERDAYYRAALNWAGGQVTPEEIQRYAQDEPGLPLEGFIAELEQSGRGQ